MTGVEYRIRWASILIGVGLMVQIGSFLVIHPLAFMTFLLIGCPLVIAGTALYLISLVTGTK